MLLKRLQQQAVDLAMLVNNSLPARSTIARTTECSNAESATAALDRLFGEIRRAQQNAADTWPCVYKMFTCYLIQHKHLQRAYDDNNRVEPLCK